MILKILHQPYYFLFSLLIITSLTTLFIFTPKVFLVLFNVMCSRPPNVKFFSHKSQSSSWFFQLIYYLHFNLQTCPFFLPRYRLIQARLINSYNKIYNTDKRKLSKEFVSKNILLSIKYIFVVGTF